MVTVKTKYWKERVSYAEWEEDGLWVELKAGWSWSDEPGCHVGMEDNVRDAKARVRDAKPCTCGNCEFNKKLNGDTYQYVQYN